MPTIFFFAIVPCCSFFASCFERRYLSHFYEKKPSLILLFICLFSEISLTNYNSLLATRYNHCNGFFLLLTILNYKHYPRDLIKRLFLVTRQYKSYIWHIDIIFSCHSISPVISEFCLIGWFHTLHHLKLNFELNIS